jgi:hypothetical protein
MHEVLLRTWNVVWFGMREPDWEDFDDEEYEELSIEEKPKRKSLNIRKP